MDEITLADFWNRPSRLEDAKSQLLGKVLVDYDRGSVASAVGGLMTLPGFQANCVRLEVLAQLAVGVCAGNKKPTHQHLNTWLNRQLGNSELVVLEDPAEDVFVTNVITRVGDFRVFPATWEQAAFATTLLVEAVSTAPDPTVLESLETVLPLLRLSDVVVARSGLNRWDMAPSYPRGVMAILPSLDVAALARRVKFTPSDLAGLGIDASVLEPFVFDDADRAGLLAEEEEETTLHRRPLLRVGDDFVLAIPGAVCYAVRRFLLACAEKSGALDKLNAALMVCARSRLNEVATHGSRHEVKRVDLPRDVQAVSGVCQSLVVEVGGGRFVQYVLVVNDIARTASSGLLFQHELSAENEAKVAGHITGVRVHLESTGAVRSGHTIVVSGLLGQLTWYEPTPAREKWTYTPINLSDLQMFLRDPDDPLDKMILLLNQEQKPAGQGVQLPNYNGFLNLYRFWTQQGFNLRHRSVGHDAAATIQLEINFVATYRRKRRVAVDEHCATLPGGKSTVVQRSNSESSYSMLREVPSYVSLDLLRQDVLGFLLESEGKALWLIMAPPKDVQARDPAFELWQALELLVYRAALMFVPFSKLTNEVTEIVLDFSGVLGQRKASEAASTETLLQEVLAASRPAYIVRAQPGFLRNFEHVENRGEQYLLAEVLRGLSMLSDVATLSAEESREAALRVLGGTGARVLHTFRVWSDVEILLASNPHETYRRPTEHIESALHSAFAWGVAETERRELNAKDTIEAFHQGVLHRVEDLQARLKAFNRTALLRRLLEENETLIADRQRWRFTARAVRGLYGDEEGTLTAQEAEGKRAQLQVSLRALIEAAACECSDAELAEPDGFQLDELVGAMTTIIDLGRDSDVVYFGLASRGMTIYPNGGFALDADLLAELAEPFMQQSFESEFRASAENYDAWTGKVAPSEGSWSDDIFGSDKLRAAWLAEYGLSLDAFREILGEIQDLAVAKGQVVLTATAAEIASNRRDAGLSEENVQAFLRSFGLPRRFTWPAQPPDAAKDIKPWRFERRLSVSLRPLVLEDDRGDRFTYGVGTARESFMYILDSIRAASFDKDVFRSREMRSWIGGAVDAQGHAFGEEVAEKLRTLGWSAASEVGMRQLGSPKKPDLGDVDVLAWREDGVVLIIECKRLKASRTIAEIAQTCNRFQGNVDDLLHKHLRRRDWVAANPTSVAKFCKLDVDKLSLRYPLVVNRVVPFKYLSNLPIPPSEVVIFDKLDSYTEEVGAR